MKTHNLSHKYELTPGLHYKVATDSESYPNLAPSSETQLGELAAVDGGIYNPPPHSSQFTSAGTRIAAATEEGTSCNDMTTLDNKGRGQVFGNTTQRAAGHFEGLKNLEQRVNTHPPQKKNE